jgi:hypothetical protein
MISAVKLLAMDSHPLRAGLHAPLDALVAPLKQ